MNRRHPVCLQIKIQKINGGSRKCSVVTTTGTVNNEMFEIPPSVSPDPPDNIIHRIYIHPHHPSNHVHSNRFLSSPPVLYEWQNVKNKNTYSSFFGNLVLI